MPYARKRSSYPGWTVTMIIVWGGGRGTTARLNGDSVPRALYAHTHISI